MICIEGKTAFSGIAIVADPGVCQEEQRGEKITC